MRHIFVTILAFFAVVFFTGCSRVQTYTVEKERVDQNLAGNRGFFAGSPSAEQLAKDSERRMTRKTYVAEVEVGLPYKAKKKGAKVEKAPSMQKEIVEEQAPDALIQEAPAQEEGVSESVKITTYTVERNDTLQKISLKVFGTTKKWKKIFDANSDVLKSPDRIYAGQVLKIPQE